MHDAGCWPGHRYFLPRKDDTVLLSMEPIRLTSTTGSDGSDSTATASNNGTSNGTDSLLGTPDPLASLSGLSNVVTSPGATSSSAVNRTALVELNVSLPYNPGDPGRCVAYMMPLPSQALGLGRPAPHTVPWNFLRYSVCWNICVLSCRCWLVILILCCHCCRHLLPDAGDEMAELAAVLAKTHAMADTWTAYGIIQAFVIIMLIAR